MKHAYLIMAHNEFQLLEILLRCLDYPQNSIFVHIDKRVKIDDIKKINLKDASLRIVQEISVSWGGGSLIECELFLFEIAIKNSDADYFHLLSGSDLPLKGQDEIHKFFEKHRGLEFIDFADEHPVNNNILDRVELYHLLPFGKRRYDAMFNKCLTAIQRNMGIKRNVNIEFYYGSEWCSVTRRFVEMLLNNKQNINKLFSYSYCGDELYKQTLYMMNEVKYNFSRYTGDISNDYNAIMRKIDWERGNPYVWTNDDYDELMSSNCLFARKFSLANDDKIIKRIKNFVLNE